VGRGGGGGEELRYPKRFALKIPFNDTYVLHTFRENQLRACCEVHWIYSHNCSVWFQPTSTETTNNIAFSNTEG